MSEMSFNVRLLQGLFLKCPYFLRSRFSIKDESTDREPTQIIYLNSSQQTFVSTSSSSLVKTPSCDLFTRNVGI